MRPGRLLASIIGVCLWLGFAGCGHYQLGTQAKLSFSTIFVENIENTANLPQATALFTTQIREALLRDGRVSLATSAQAADVVLTVDLNRFSRNVATVRRSDTGLARSFDLELVALCTLRDNRSGKALFQKRPVSATREIFTSDGNVERGSNGEPIFVSRQQQAEFQTLPLIASTLADRVAHAVLDVW